MCELFPSSSRGPLPAARLPLVLENLEGPVSGGGMVSFFVPRLTSLPPTPSRQVWTAQDGRPAGCEGTAGTRRRWSSSRRTSRAVDPTHLRSR
ncbi:hypothetical protein VUR80DRAFT_1455 [Thermomyces stellatus]